MEVGVMFSVIKTARCGHVIKTETKSATETEKVTFKSINFLKIELKTNKKPALDVDKRACSQYQICTNDDFMNEGHRVLSKKFFININNPQDSTVRTVIKDGTTRTVH